ncbi:MAG: MFS transporter [Verrucomicrobia bacterium]|nr:MFS transporter [Verrucomicrobiota bacterium]
MNTPTDPPTHNSSVQAPDHDRGGLFRTADGTSHLTTFLLVCCLFCLSGLCNGMIDVLNKHFQNTLHVSKAQSALVQGFWYGGYFLLALPAGLFARRYGYRGGILLGLTIITIGCVCFVPVTRIVGSQATVFSVFLLALALVACGFTFIETIANPYATVLGAPNAGVARINLAQSCNAVGWIFGPLLGGSFILSKTGEVNTSNASLYIPYLIVAGIVAVLIVAFVFAPVPELHVKDADLTVANGRIARPLIKERHLVWAIASQFLYCAAQTGIFSFFINYVKDPGSMPALPSGIAGWLPSNMKYLEGGAWHITEYCASAMLSLAFIFFTVGRFSGSALLRFAPAHRVLGIYAMCNVVLMLLIFLGLGWISVAALILSFFFMSIMYPTHFALAIHGLGERTKLGSSWMVTAVVGGAVMPMLMGWLADHSSMRVGFLMPLGCFVCIMLYGFGWQRLYRADVGVSRVPS